MGEAGWPLDQARDTEHEVTGMPNETGTGYVDYVLWGADGRPLAVVEAKRTKKSPQVGHRQAEAYADCLEAEFGRRPVIFCTNGDEHWLWDDAAGYPPREVRGFYTRDELELMATGAGKTRTVIALVDQLMKAGWVKRVLFLADRTALVNQAVGAFKAHLPAATTVNLVMKRDTDGRVYASTYPTMLNIINDGRFGPGYFDLVVIDEAHRSVYQKYRASRPSASRSARSSPPAAFATTT